MAGAASGRTFLGANVSAGLGAGIASEREGADCYEAVPSVYLRMDWNKRYLQISGKKIESNLISHPTWRAGPVVQFRRNAFAGASGRT